MKIGLHALENHKIQLEKLVEIVRFLYDQGYILSWTPALCKTFEKPQFSFCPKGQIWQADQSGENKPDLLISLGGDGTVLDCLLHAVEDEIPILGINFGRMGFLASDQDPISLLTDLKEKALNIVERTLLEVWLEEGESIFSKNFALNEFSIAKRDSASMITIETLIDGCFLNEYWGDGLIISTATGSTGYSLSCGGPILFPENQNFIITPISPHNLSMRPLVVPDTVSITLIPHGRQQKVMVSMDSRSKAINTHQKLVVRKSPLKAKFVQTEQYSFEKTIREKLFWGKDLRN